MDPTQFTWEEHQPVVVTNPTKEDFDFLVYGKKYRVPAGQDVEMPGFIAWKYCYDMALKLCHADGQFIRWNDEGFRDQYFYDGTDKRPALVVEVRPMVRQVSDEPEPEVHTFNAAGNNSRRRVEDRTKAGDDTTGAQDGDASETKPAARPNRRAPNRARA